MDFISPSLIPDLSFMEEYARLILYKKGSSKDCRLFRFIWFLKIRNSQISQYPVGILFFFAILISKCL